MVPYMANRRACALGSIDTPSITGTPTITHMSWR